MEFIVQLFTTVFTRVAIIVLAALFIPSLSAAEKPSPTPPVIDMAISFDLDNKQIRGTARITIEEGQGLDLFLPEMTITDAFLSTPQRENAPIEMVRLDMLELPAADVSQTLLISWTKTIEDSFANIISERAIVLTSSWHPIPRTPAKFSLSGEVPEGFTALSQSDQLAETNPGKPFSFSFSQPLRSPTFVAAPYVREQRSVRPGLSVYTMFFKEDGDLADDYLAAAVDYINRYERLIGEFPYNHYVIAENIMPTGYGFPTFTLLGRQVIRLPFIKETSLGHEILHSWFGNSIDIGEGSGNWSEGLTTYLADMAFRSDAGEGALARKEAIQRYQDYLTETAPTLNEFRWAGHDRAASRPARVVGYQKSAMLFHELSRRVGAETFVQSIRDFYQKFRGQAATWDDIRTVFETHSGEDLSTFFSERLRRNDLPELAISNVSVRQGGENSSVALTISQMQPEPYELQIPVVIETLAGPKRFLHTVSAAEASISFELDTTPLEVAIDPEYDLMRSLTDEEVKPVWSSLLGAQDCLLIVNESADKERYRAFIDGVQRYGCELGDASELSQNDIETRSLIFLGTENSRLRTIYGDPAHPEPGFTLDVRKNPFNRELAAAIVSSSSTEQTERVARRLTHYGKYSYLHFKAGQLVEKRLPETVKGIRVPFEEKPRGFALTTLKPFETMVAELARKDVVYIGETHTSRPDHLLQMMLIEALYYANENLAIGLEMFPRSSQPALDRYINDPEFSESEFIRDSRYFQVWGYDYRLFRPIFTFARNHKIPLIGLNIERDIVSSVFQNGSLDGLNDEQRDQLPAEMRLDFQGYVERLARSHLMHTQGNLADGALAGFIKAQALWDETMAESISTYLGANPGSMMVVLAGSQHTRKDSGIPPRVAARIDVDQATVLNQATNRASALELRQTADYLFLLESSEFKEQGKIGVVLLEKEGSEGTIMEIVEVNPQSNAVAAGVKEDDILIFIDELAIHTMDDVRLALLDKAVGETVQVSVLRGGEKSGTQVDLAVELFNPSLPAGHP